LEKIDDASTEIMMADQGKVLLYMGGAFLETSEEEATQHCEDMVEQQQQKINALESEERDILEQQNGLKKILYGRFGKSIQLEE
jgi:prefoldin subunit 4